MDEAFVVSVRERLSVAEGLFETGSERLESVYASSGLRLSYASIDWALIEIEITSTRFSTNIKA